MIANRVILENASPFAFKSLPITMVLLVVLISAGPLCVFIGKLRKTHEEAMFTYGALAGELGEHFKRRWVTQAQDLERGFEARDFSATNSFLRVMERRVRDG